MFLLTELTLEYFFPTARVNFEIWVKYFIRKDQMYDIMFFLSFLLVFWKMKGFDKSIALFITIMAGGSVLDKLIFGVNQYVWSDLVLIFVAIAVSLYKYFKNGGYKSLAY